MIIITEYEFFKISEKLSVIEKIYFDKKINRVEIPRIKISIISGAWNGC